MQLWATGSKLVGVDYVVVRGFFAVLVRKEILKYDAFTLDQSRQTTLWLCICRLTEEERLYCSARCCHYFLQGDSHASADFISLATSKITCLIAKQVRVTPEGCCISAF